MDVTDLRALRRAVQKIGDTPGGTPSSGSSSTTASLHGTSP